MPGTIAWLLLTAGSLLGLLSPNMPQAFPLSYEVHISLSDGAPRNASSRGPNYATYQGFDLKEIIAAIYHVRPSRVELPAAFDDGKLYDFALWLPQDESDEQMDGRIQAAIQSHFHLQIAFELRPVDVYVLTASGGKSHSMKRSPEDFGGSVGSLWLGLGGQRRAEAKDTSGISTKSGASLTGIGVSDETMDDLCGALETALDRLVVNETQLPGRYSFKVEGKPQTTSEFLQELRNQVGLALAPGRRSVRLVVGRPA